MLTSIFRHPVKGLPGEAVSEIRLERRHAMPGDRVYALVHAKSGEGRDGAWAPCRHFARVALSPQLVLADLRLKDDVAFLRIEGEERRFDLEDEGQAAGFARALEAFADPRQPPPYALVRAKEGALTDSAAQTVSIGNLASLRALEQLAGKPLDPRRFRANLWIDVEPAWIERSWVRRPFSIGAVEFLGVENIERCAATTIDPETAASDAPVPRLLRRHFGHFEFALSAAVERGGVLAIGDAINLK